MKDQEGQMYVKRRPDCTYASELPAFPVSTALALGLRARFQTQKALCGTSSCTATIEQVVLFVA
jgi:hypothetical protein